jgi:leucine-rich repeat protein SHOC2
LPENIGNLTRLNQLYLHDNQLTVLPESISELGKLKELDISGNQIRSLPQSMSGLTNLVELNICYNPLTDLSILQTLPRLKHVIFLGEWIHLHRRYWTKFSEWKSEWILDEKSGRVRSILIRQFGLDRILTDLANIFEPDESNLELKTTESVKEIDNLTQLKISWMLNVNLPRRYWRKFSEWKAEWLLDEKNAEIRRRLIEHIGYERICDELGAIAIDIWQEYTLLKIDNIQIVYQGWKEVGKEPMMLLKMTCPSTAHIHILRVPPDMTSAEAAIVWVNHGIHPSKFSVQT